MAEAAAIDTRPRLVAVRACHGCGKPRRQPRPGERLGLMTRELLPCGLLLYLLCDRCLAGEQEG